MAFVICEDQKQHINLSNFAWSTLENDMTIFYKDSHKKMNLSGFLNRIFTQYHLNAEATISQRLQNYDQKLRLIFNTTETIEDKKTIIFAIKTLLEERKNELIDINTSYKKGKAKKFRINNDNYEHLTEESIENTYYSGSSGLYLKALFEEYARHPFYEREKIFFKTTIDKFYQAINTRVKLKLKLTNKKQYLFNPFAITTDQTASFNYLVGYVGDKLVSFRLSKIEKTKLMISKVAFVSKEKANHASTMLQTQGPQFLAGDLVDISVQLTQKGIEKYQNQIHLRPDYTKIDDNNIFWFRCSEVQALYYFFKFGRDAIVLRPDSLRLRFKRYYESALKNY